MAIGDVGKVCLMSAISGTITLDGKPVANAKLVRTVNNDSNGRDKTDETTTDENGYFTFPTVFERTIAKYLPMEFVVGQYISAHYQGKEYKFWFGVKRKEEENTESRGKPLIVKCELNQEILVTRINGSAFQTLCTWDTEPDPPILDPNESPFDTSYTG